MHTRNSLPWRMWVLVAFVLLALLAGVEKKYGPGANLLVLAVVVAFVRWRFFTLSARIRRGWPALSRALNLWQQEPIGRLAEEFHYRYPQLSRVRRMDLGFEVSVWLLPGQTPRDLADHVEAIAHTWRVFRVDASSPERRVVLLRAWTSDPLEDPFPASPLGCVKDDVTEPRDTDIVTAPVALPAARRRPLRDARSALRMDSGRPDDSTADPADGWEPEYRTAEIGRCDDGAPWTLRLHGTHVLVAGVTGAGKGSVLWGIIRALLPAVKAGLVELWACDPKRMELSFGRALFQRYACEPAAMVELLEDAAAKMNERAQGFAGRVRSHTPSADCPFIVVLVDELAFLTAYQPDRDLRKRADAAIATLTSQGRSVGFCVVGALQDPRKEVMNIRNLFPDRIALRLDEPGQVDMVLGQGARDRGARADLISPNPTAGAGVGYVKRETQPEPVRVRAAFISDDDIDAMVRDFGHGVVTA